MQHDQQRTTCNYVYSASFGAPHFKHLAASLNFPTFLMTLNVNIPKAMFSSAQWLTVKPILASQFLWTFRELYAPLFTFCNMEGINVHLSCHHYTICYRNPTLNYIFPLRLVLAN